MLSHLADCFPCFSRLRERQRDDEEEAEEEDHQLELARQREVDALRVALYTQLYGSYPETSSPRTNEELRGLFRDSAIVRRGGVPENLAQGHLSLISYRVPEPTPGLDDDQDGHHCPICLDGFIDGQIITSLDCNHNFHIECAKKWLVENNNCPLCREKAVKAEINVFSRIPDILADHLRV